MLATARLDYGLRALVALAGAGRPLTADEIAAAQQLPAYFLRNVLLDLRRESLVQSRRHGGRGYELTKPASEITVAEVMRALAGPPETSSRESPLAGLWGRLNERLDRAAGEITLLDLVGGLDQPRPPEPVSA